ncbi:MAG: dihydropteroate synthase [Paracoccus sp. (in: a-proteobacteria)]|uniref:dihydropteroate synthase n=1 Tax=Paracoccus sp. TaxID=267 RepID=UPI0026DFABA0|nr:dihydropteroate synthase [Paracoccus sp. (in: a-proteobacteria)]MDO5621324.1 dihydropteroate synthase [Paracoccus sp. (in: a-proteobacteria)]
MSRDFFRPLPLPAHEAPADSLSLAGGWTRFAQVEHLRRGQPPRILPASELPDDWRLRLTAPRPPILGITMERPSVMGIVNVTPDSFSDGGQWLDPADAIAHGHALIAAGADILDIGGESTRPGAREVPAAEEIARLVPVISALSGAAPISVDTRKASVARAALDAGAGLVNDVSGFDFDPEMHALVASRNAPVCLMHAQGLPETMQDDPRYGDVLLDVYEALENRVKSAVTESIPCSHIIVDPGIGFGKTEAHNLAILRRISLFHGLGCAVLLGLSRKRFIGAIGRVEDAQSRDPGTLALSLAAIRQGVQMHRVHDVSGVVQGIRLWKAVEIGFEQSRPE